MTLKTLCALLSSVHPTAYMHFEEAQEPPFIVYGLEGDSDFMADNRHYFPVCNGFIELYCGRKDPLAELEIERLLTKNEIPWGKETEVYIPDQRIHQTRWSVQLIGG